MLDWDVCTFSGVNNCKLENNMEPGAVVEGVQSAYCGSRVGVSAGA